jgi:hypothetical protein
LITLNNQKTFIALTALWAFVEAGLGGFLHALHLPFTGIVLGGFAVLIISLLAMCYDKPFAKIVQATLIVLAIKAAVNPATSPFAYLAVGFQGLLGAALYSIKKNNFIIHFLFATIAMLESAAQKLLVMTLFLGKSFWQGVDGLGKSVAETFHYTSTTSYSFWLIFLYLGIFFVWGIILAMWMQVLPTQIANRNLNYQHLQAITFAEISTEKKQKSKWRIASYILIAAGIISFFLPMQKGISTAFIYLLRTISILAIWQIFILPIWQQQIVKWSSKYSSNNSMYASVNALLPSIAIMVRPLYAEVASQYKGFKKWKEFLLGLMVITLNIDDCK